MEFKNYFENEFQYHMKGRISENIMGRSYCRLLNILEENEDVQAVSSNFDVSDEVLASLTA